jgi:hypothetical protein
LDGVIPDDNQTNGSPRERELSPAAQRALDEAKQRRQSAAATEAAATEIAGRGGLDPARYGDWEIKGLASDF